MGRRWQDVKAEKARRDLAAGHDVTQARELARRRTQALIADFRLTQLRQLREADSAKGGPDPGTALHPNPD